MLSRFARLAAWVRAHDRMIGALFFLGGFIANFITLGGMSLDAISLFFLAYLVLAGVCTLGTHRFALIQNREAWWKRGLAILLPLGAHFAIGALLSGFAVFYAQHAEASVSWPFLTFLFIAAILGEYWTRHKAHLVFQTVMFFVALYAYAIFIVPLITHSLGPWVFIGSTIATAVVFALFMVLLRFTNLTRLRASRRSIIVATAVIVGVMNLAYFTGFIPPVPLVAPVADVYQEFSHANGIYTLGTDSSAPWWNPLPRTLAHLPGTPLYAFSAVVAPGNFATTIVHVWERYDETEKKWIEENRVAFPILGGRPAGYRGYSVMQHPEQGKWRVTIETTSGQVIARVAFTLRDAPSVVITRHDSF
jgi:hypothetical protein